MSFKRLLVGCLMLGVGGCTSSHNAGSNGTQNNTPGVTGSGGVSATGNAGGTSTPTNSNTGSGGTASGGKAGTSPSVTGSGGSSTSGGAGKAVQMNGTGGAGDMSAGSGAGGSSGSTDTSGFVKDCLQGGAQWGTPQQAGPCSSGITTYGVHQMFGPYGVRSEYNVGKGFETGGTDDSAYCNGVFIPSFGADPKGSMDLMDTHDLDFGLFTVFYPGVMGEGEKFPLITWGNGTCAMPEGYGPLLRYVASFGYIVVAANNREVGDGGPLLKGLDFMLAENEKADSKYYHRIDTDKIGAMGHSQGAAATVAAASDPRIKAIIAFNSGTSTDKPFLNISGDMDIGAGTDDSSHKNSSESAPKPGAWIWYHQVPQNVNGSTTGTLGPGHLTLMMESERVIEPAVAWWDMMLKGNADAKKMFLGDNCTLCDTSTFPSMWPPYVGLDNPAHEYGHNAMLQ